MTSRALGWIIIPVTLLALQVLVPHLPTGLSPLGLWGGLSSAGAVALYTFWPALSFQRVSLIPLYITAQFVCWSLIWQHSANSSGLHWVFLSWLIPCWIVSFALVKLMRRFVVVSSHG